MIIIEIKVDIIKDTKKPYTPKSHVTMVDENYNK